MSTTDHAGDGTGSAEDDGLCDVCGERRARWFAAGQGQSFRVCDPCREGEPCARCAVERNACECPEGPDIFVWLPIAGSG